MTSTNTLTADPIQNDCVIELSHEDMLRELSEYRDHLLQPEQRAQLSASGLIGVQDLRDILDGMPSAPVESRQWLTGIELERSGVDLITGKPLFAKGQQLLEDIQCQVDWRLGTTTCELAKHQFEHNSPPYIVKENVFSRIERDIRTYKSEVNRIAASYQAAITAAGILPSLEPGHLTPDNISNAPRYHPLIAAVIDYCRNEDPTFTRTIHARHGETYVRLFRDENHLSHLEIVSPQGRLQIRNLSMLLESVMTSLQVHIGVPNPNEYVGHHRVAEWISAPLVALTAASPFLFMRRTGFMESRNGFLWEATVHHKRVGFLGNSWINSNLEQLAVAQELGPLLTLRDANKIRNSGLNDDIRSALETAKTCWPFVRTTLGFMDQGIIPRIEHRVMSAGPTITDEVANLAFCYGLVTGFYRSLRAQGIPIDADPDQLNVSMPFQNMYDNFYIACVDALDGTFTWLNGEKAQARSLLRDQLLPIVNAGLLHREVSEADCDRYLRVIQDRLDFDWSRVRSAPPEWIAQKKRGCTPADLQIFINHVLEQQGGNNADDCNRAGAMTKLLCQIGLDDQQSYENTGVGCGMTGWIMKNYGDDAALSTAHGK